MNFEDIRILRVTMTVDYYVPTFMNGGDLDKTIQEWFVNYPLGKAHATRDYYEGKKTFISAGEVKKENL